VIPKLDAAMHLILEIRANARKNKDWPTSDLIRDQLKAAGIRVEDGPEGSTWKLEK
jgi:cysteinyl-tRNA synthetase